MTSIVTLPEEFVHAAVERVRERTGLIFPGARRKSFAAGLSRALHRAHGTSATATAYLEKLDRDTGLLDDLVAEITVGETYFFREAGQCKVVRDRILPSLRGRAGGGRALRVWSAGCATGEEPYSLAIMLQELGIGPAQVVGTDLSRQALSRARAGSYGRWSLRGVPEPTIQRYFTMRGGRYHLDPTVKAAVEFRYLNLAEDSYPSPAVGVWDMDLIVCRNVLIYFDAETIARAARGLLDSLSADGWLLMGSSDPPLSQIVPCHVIMTEAGLAYRRAESGGESWTAPLQAVAVLAGAEPPGDPPTAVAPPEAPVDAPASPPPPVEPGGAAQHYAAGEYARAAQLATEATARAGDDPDLWILLVRSLANLGQLEGAGRACATGLDRHPISAELTYLHAMLLAEGRHDIPAAKAASQALYLERGLIVAHMAQGTALARLGDSSGAQRALRNALLLLDALPPDAIVPASDGESAGHLLGMARLQLSLLQGAAP